MEIIDERRKGRLSKLQPNDVIRVYRGSKEPNSIIDYLVVLVAWDTDKHFMLLEISTGIISPFYIFSPEKYFKIGDILETNSKEWYREEICEIINNSKVQITYKD